jgi:predicted permease
VASFLLLIVCLGLGVLVTRLGRPPEGLAKHLNWWVLHVALPAMVLQYIPHLQFDLSLWFLFVPMWFIFGASWLIFHQLGTRLGWSRGTIGAIVLTAGLCNTSFVGFPLFEALRGKGILTYAAITDQLGCFMDASIGGSMVVAMYSGGHTDIRAIGRKVLQFPPFIALCVALIVAATPGWPGIVEEVLAHISASLAPLALFSVGLQLRFKIAPHATVPFFAGLSWKLGLAPLLVFAVGSVLHIQQPILTVTTLGAAMAPMVTAAILAEQGNLDPQLANMMLGIGIVLSFITVPLWNLLV